MTHFGQRDGFPERLRPVVISIFRNSRSAPGFFFTEKFSTSSGNGESEMSVAVRMRQAQNKCLQNSTGLRHVRVQFSASLKWCSVQESRCESTCSKEKSRIKPRNNNNERLPWRHWPQDQWNGQWQPRRVDHFPAALSASHSPGTTIRTSSHSTFAFNLFLCFWPLDLYYQRYKKYKSTWIVTVNPTHMHVCLLYLRFTSISLQTFEMRLKTYLF